MIKNIFVTLLCIAAGAFLAAVSLLFLGLGIPGKCSFGLNYCTLYFSLVGLTCSMALTSPIALALSFSRRFPRFLFWGRTLTIGLPAMCCALIAVTFLVA